MSGLEHPPVHVVHVLASLAPGGLENGVVHVIGSADPERVKHSVVCLDEEGELASRLPDGVAVHVVGRRPGMDLRALLRTVELVHSLRPDVVHTRNWASLVEGAVAARASGAKLVHGLHGRTHAELKGVSWKRRLLESWLVRRADRVVVLLPSLRSEAIAHRVAPEKVRTIENGVDLARFHPDLERRTRARFELGAHPGDIVVGCVARLDPVKDHATLFRAFTKLGDRAILAIVGDGPRRRSLEMLARIDGVASRVRFLGHRSDPSAFYPAFDIFALASRYEGSSNTVLEAMASGVPVVTTKIGGNPSLVSEQAGVLVEVGDIDALGAALGKLSRDSKRRAALSAGALRVAREKSLERMGQVYERMYLDVAGAASRPSVSTDTPRVLPTLPTSERRAA